MELIAAVYEDWGIGAKGTQPITLSADRALFRQTTRGCAVILGRRTMEDFPGRRSLPGRENILLTRSSQPVPGFTLASSVEEAAEKTAGKRAFVIGGGSVYRQMLPLCDRAYITKIHARPESDAFLPNLDADPAWEVEAVLQSGEEGGIRYEMLLYRRKA